MSRRFVFAVVLALVAAFVPGGSHAAGVLPSAPAVYGISRAGSGALYVSVVLGANGGNPVLDIDFQVSTSPSFSPATLVENGTSAATFQRLSGLANGTLYYVRARQSTVLGSSGWSAAKSYTPQAGMWPWASTWWPTTIAYLPASAGLGTPADPIDFPGLGYGYWFLQYADFSSPWFHGSISTCGNPPQLLFEWPCLSRTAVRHVNQMSDGSIIACMGEGPCPGAGAYHIHFQTWSNAFGVWKSVPKPVVTANNDTVSTVKAKALSILVLANDTALNTTIAGSMTSVTVPPVHGSTSVAASGAVTYTPSATFVGVDRFTYRACDADLFCDTAVVTVTVSPAPVVSAVADVAVTGKNSVVAVPVLANDSATYTTIDPSKTAVAIVPSHGSATVSSAGVVTYTPAVGYVGSDAFVYRACDAVSVCDTATVSVTVTETAVVTARDDVADTLQGAPIAVGVLDNDVATNTTIVKSKTAVVTSPAHGVATVNSVSGTITYTPSAAFVGSDSFSYKACDLSLVCSTATVTVTVAAPSAPSFPAASLDVPVLEANAFLTAQQNLDQTIRFAPLVALTCNGGQVAPCGAPPAVAPSSGSLSGLGAGPYLVSSTLSSFSLTPPAGYSSPADYRVVSQPVGRSLTVAQDVVLNFMRATASGTSYRYSAQATITYQLRPWTWAAGDPAPVWGVPVTKTQAVTLTAPGCHPNGCAFGVLGAGSR